MSGRANPADVFRLGRALRRTSPEVVQTWMLHSNVLGGFVTRLVSRARVSWGVHLSRLQPRDARDQGDLRHTAPRRSAPGSSPRASSPARSARARRCSRLPYRRKRIVTIPNGFDTARFRPDPEAREEVRRELGLSPSTTVVGHLARNHPIKDHPTLLAAAKQVVEHGPRRSLRARRRRGDTRRPEAEGAHRAARRQGDAARQPRATCPGCSTPSTSPSPPPPARRSRWRSGRRCRPASRSRRPAPATRPSWSPTPARRRRSATPKGSPRRSWSWSRWAPSKRRELGTKARARISTFYSMRGMADSYVRLWSELGAGRKRTQAATPAAEPES